MMPNTLNKLSFGDHISHNYCNIYTVVILQ